MEHESKRGKGFLVMHAILSYHINSTFSSLKCHFLSLFSLFFTFNSLFKLHWLLCNCFFHIHGHCSYLYHNLVHALFPFLPLFSPTILPAVGIHSFNIFPTIFWPCSVRHNPTKVFQSMPYDKGPSHFG